MPTSSQGLSLISGARKISMKASRGAGGGGGNNRLDASTLSLAHGSLRVYEDGLPDGGAQPGSNGVTVTVSADGIGSPPAVGATITAMGLTCKCTESSIESSVGELQAWSASYTSDYATGGS